MGVGTGPDLEWEGGKGGRARLKNSNVILLLYSRTSSKQTVYRVMLRKDVSIKTMNPTPLWVGVLVLELGALKPS